MAKPLVVNLSAAQRQELMAARDRHPRPYIRERAAAILKMAGGSPGREVALHGLHKPRQPDTVYRWLRRYQAEGLAGLRVRQGRGRKPAFSPSAAGR